MPELVSYSTSNPTPPPPPLSPELAAESTPPGGSSPPPSWDMPEPPPAPPPQIISSDWENWEGFRFTLLRYFTRPEDTAALRQIGQLLYEMALEHPRIGWPEMPGPETFWELTCVLAEFRFLEGYLGSVFEEKEKSSLPREVESLCKFAGGLSYEMGEMGRRLNEELGKWRNRR